MDKIATTTKKCDKCNRELPLNCFHKNKRNSDGLQCTCKECKRLYNKEHYYAKKGKITPPQSVMNPHPIFSKMQPRELIAEIRERINYLRDNGWTFNGTLEYTQTKTVKL